VKNRLAVLVAELSVKKGRKVTIAEVAEETDVSHTTLNKYIQQRATRFDGDTLEKLCNYFEVGIEELIYIEPNPKRKASPQPEQA